MKTRIIGTFLHDTFVLVGQMRLGCSGMRSGIVGTAAVLAVLLTPPAWADYAAGQEAWEAGRIAEALSEWEAAAAEGDVRAMMTLGRAYQRGAGVPQDYILAHFWFNVAASQDDSRAVAERDSLAELMTVEEQAEARKLLRKWRSKKQSTAEVEAPEPASSAAAPGIEPPPPRAIKEAQSLLAQLGYSPGSADGIWGKQTSEAYRAFLGDADLPAAETLTPKNLRILREIAARQGEEEQPEESVSAQTPTDALHRAAKAGDLDGLNASLEAGINIDRRDKQGRTALMHAVNKGNVLVVEVLLEAGADVDVRAPDGATALFMSAVLGDPQIVAQLMKAGADISIRGPKGKTAVDVARLTLGELDSTRANGADIAVVGLLRGQTWGEILSQQSAAKDFVALLGREPSADTVDENGWTDLHWAAVLNKPNLAKILIEEGIDTTVQMKADNKNVSNKLIADLNRVTDSDPPFENFKRRGQVPLYFAAYMNSVEMAKLLIEHGANVNVRDKKGRRPIHSAAGQNSLEVAKLLTEHRTDVSARDNDRITPMHHAAGQNSVEMAKLLIEHGANVSVNDKDGRTPIHSAAGQNSLEVAKLIIEHGANVSARDENGYTAMHFAAVQNSVEIAKLLIEHGANVSVNDKDGRTPIHSAAGQNSTGSGEAYHRAWCQCQRKGRKWLYSDALCGSTEFSGDSEAAHRAWCQCQRKGQTWLGTNAPCGMGEFSGDSEAASSSMAPRSAQGTNKVGRRCTVRHGRIQWKWRNCSSSMVPKSV